MPPPSLRVQLAASIVAGLYDAFDGLPLSQFAVGLTSGPGTHEKANWRIRSTHLRQLGTRFATPASLG